MPIITLQTAKNLLKLSGSSYDTQIQELIPIIQDWTMNHLNNYFEQELEFITYSGVFSNSRNSFADDDYDFTELGFLPDMEIRIKGSLFNDGIHKIQSILAEEIVFTSDTEIVDEESSLEIKLVWIKFPPGLKIPIAMMIGEDLNLTERNADQEYSNSVLKKLKPYMRVYIGT